MLSRAEALKQLPNLRFHGLKGGVKYWDGQFNDARYAMALARTAVQHGALLINYCEAKELTYDDQKLTGVICEDVFTRGRYRIRSHCVVNATGVWVDEVHRVDGLAAPSPTKRVTSTMVAPSQGVHMAVDREFLKSDSALRAPKTADGHVLFAVPWLGKVIFGTTDTPRQDLALEPRPFPDEVAFILTESARHLSHAPKFQNIKIIWVGLRPLAKPPDDGGDNTKVLSREYTIVVSRSGLVMVTGGKWTTFRAMAEDVLEKCASAGLLVHGKAGRTKTLRLLGAGDFGQIVEPIHEPPGWHSFGAEEGFVRGLPGADAELSFGLTQAMVRFAARHEYAMCVEDVLARRSKLFFLDAALASSLAVRVGDILTQETGCAPHVAEFQALTAQYLPAIEKVP